MIIYRHKETGITLTHEKLLEIVENSIEPMPRIYFKVPKRLKVMMTNDGAYLNEPEVEETYTYTAKGIPFSKDWEPINKGVYLNRGEIHALMYKLSGSSNEDVKSILEKLYLKYLELADLSDRGILE